MLFTIHLDHFKWDVTSFKLIEPHNKMNGRTLRIQFVLADLSISHILRLNHFYTYKFYNIHCIIHNNI